MPAQNEASFAEILGQYVTQRGYTCGQLAQLSGVPKRTIAHWLEGIVKRPRDWRDLVKLAAVLHLKEADATLLLRSAQYPAITQLLAQAVNEQDRSLLSPWTDSVQERQKASPFQAIANLPYFVGRAREIETLKQILLSTQLVKLCSLQGMAGSGKTTLAAYLAYQLRPYFPDGVLWARLDRSDTMTILSSFARAYGLDTREYRDIESRSRVVRELLANKRSLIVLDNVETSDQAEPLLPPSGTCAVLLTSRRHDLAIARGTHCFEIGPFEQREDSLALFTKLLGREQVEREQETFTKIAGLLGDLPLALDIAASRLAREPGWSAVDFLTRLRGEQSRLKELVYDNQNVRLSFNISYQNLSDEQCIVFHALGTFGGEDFSLEAAAYVSALSAEEAADRLRSLYALSLVQLSRPGRYRLHPLLRELALESEGIGELFQRMVSFFVQYGETHRSEYSALDLELANLLPALEAAFERGLHMDLIRGAEALADFLEARGLYEQAELHLGRAIQIAGERGDKATQAFLLCKLGRTSIYAGKLTVAEQHLQTGLLLTHQIESPERIPALLLGHLGLIAYMRNDYDAMEQYFQKAQPLARASDELETICRLLEGLNEIAQRRGDYAAAERYCREGVTLARQLGNRELISILLKSLANAIFERGGDYTEVHACLQESLTAAHETGHHRLICLSLLSFGYITCEHGEYEQAETYLQEVLLLMQMNDFPVERTFTLCTLALTARGRQRYDKSAAYLHEALDLAQQLGITVLFAPIQNAWGWLHFQQQAWEAAVAAFSEALKIARQTGVRIQIAQALYGLAHVAAARGDLVTARQNGQDSLAILNTMEHRTRADVQNWVLTLG